MTTNQKIRVKIHKLRKDYEDKNYDKSRELIRFSK